MKFVQQQFFPSSDRNELVVDWNLPQNASIADTKAQMERFEREQLQGNARVDHWSTYVGSARRGSFCPSTCSRRTPWFGQMVIVTKGDRGPRPRQGASSRPI